LPYSEAENPIKAGWYLVTVDGCIDCHTDGYFMLEGNIPEENWLTGSPLGLQGPLETTWLRRVTLILPRNILMFSMTHLTIPEKYHEISAIRVKVMEREKL